MAVSDVACCTVVSLHLRECPCSLCRVPGCCMRSTQSKRSPKRYMLLHLKVFKRIVAGTGCCQVTVHFSRHWTGKTLPSSLSIVILTVTLSYLGFVNSHYRAVVDTSIVTKHTCDAFLLLYSASMDATRVRIRERFSPSLNFPVKKV